MTGGGGAPVSLSQTEPRPVDKLGRPPAGSHFSQRAHPQAEQLEHRPATMSCRGARHAWTRGGRQPAAAEPPASLSRTEPRPVDKLGRPPAGSHLSQRGRPPLRCPRQNPEPPARRRSRAGRRRPRPVRTHVVFLVQVGTPEVERPRVTVVPSSSASTRRTPKLRRPHESQRRAAAGSFFYFHENIAVAHPSRGARVRGAPRVLPLSRGAR